jgi:hypothetical protein
VRNSEKQDFEAGSGACSSCFTGGFPTLFQVLYAPDPGSYPGEHSFSITQPKIARLSTVTTVLENLRKLSNYSIQVLAFNNAGDGKLAPIVTCATHRDGKLTHRRFFKLPFQKLGKSALPRQLIFLGLSWALLTTFDRHFPCQ